MRTIPQIIQKEPIESFLQKGMFDPIYFIENVFGIELAWFHKEWINLVRKNRFVCITASRGTSKTTVLGIWYPLWYCWYKRNKNIMVVANSLEQSTRIMDLIRETIEDNELLRELMPNDRSITWKKSEINTTTKCKIFVRALTENIRGLRNDYVLSDEIGQYEDIELFRRVIEPTVDLRKGTIVGIGTPKSTVDLLSVLSKNKLYISRVYKLYDKGRSIWPEMYSKGDLEAIKLRIGEAAFASEYECNANAEVENAIFPSELVASCFDFNRKFNAEENENGIRILSADFAIAKGPTADFDAFIVVEKVAGVTVIKHGERHRGLSIAGKTSRIRELYEMHRCEAIYIDPSNVGAAVGEELRSLGYPVYNAEMHSQARNHLIINLRRMMENKQLIIPRDMEDMATFNFSQILVSELLGFKQAKSKFTDTLQLRSTSPHDDLAISLAIACKGISNKKEFVDMMAM